MTNQAPLISLDKDEQLILGILLLSNRSMSVKDLEHTTKSVIMNDFMSRSNETERQKVEKELHSVKGLYKLSLKRKQLLNRYGIYPPVYATIEKMLLGLEKMGFIKSRKVKGKGRIISKYYIDPKLKESLIGKHEKLYESLVKSFNDFHGNPLNQWVSRNKVYWETLFR